MAYHGNHLIESYEVEKLQDLIDGKKEYLRSITNQNHARKLQSEILFLEKDILPIVQRETTLLYSEIAAYTQRKTGEALQYNCDAILLFIPLSSGLSDECVVGVANPKEQKFGREEIENIEVAISSIGIGRRKINIVNLPL